MAAIIPWLLTPTADAQTPQSLACGLEPGPTRAIVGVLDGDTVRLDDGKLVRLLGIAAPKAIDTAGDSKHWPPAEAARLALEKEVRGRSVSLAFSGARTDRYNRVRAHIFISDGSEMQWLQRNLVDAGHARVLSAPGEGKCAASLLDAERAARTASRGLWANAAYQIRPGDRPTELRRYAGSLQIVAGSIQRVIQGRTVVIVELANAEARASAVEQREAGALRLTIPREPRATDGQVGKLERGAFIEARGWIASGRSGPEIEILALEDIAILKEAAATETEPQTGKRNRTTAKRKRPEAELPGEPKQ